MKNKDIYKSLYNEHSEYKSLREKKDNVYKKYVNDVKYWKLKYLEKLVYENTDLKEINSVLEIGCATGILLDSFLRENNIQKTGIDISDKNISIAKESFPNIKFISGTIEEFIVNNGEKVDVVILSDILEHVEDDVNLLRLSGLISKYVLINLPIEKVEEYKNRDYGINDIEGHLRAYSTQDAFDLCKKSGTDIIAYYEQHYVKEPIFRKYLIEKLIVSTDDISSALLRYHEELIEIDLNTENYKRNFFALLRNNSNS